MSGAFSTDSESKAYTLDTLIEFSFDHSYVCRLMFSTGAYRNKPDGPLESSEGAITELFCAQAEALGPVVKVPHEPHLLSNAKPHHRDLPVCEQVYFAGLILDNLQTYMQTHMWIWAPLTMRTSDENIC